MRHSTATIENVAPATQRDLGGVSVYLVEVRFRLDEEDDQRNIATQVSFQEIDKVWGVSQETGKLWQQDWSKSVYPLENGVFVATLPDDPNWKVGKKVSVILPNIAE
jgi:hypothetical protein